MHGIAKMDTISVDLLRHYAEDAARQKTTMQITEPRFVLEFIADGINRAMKRNLVTVSLLLLVFCQQSTKVQNYPNEWWNGFVYANYGNK